MTDPNFVNPYEQIWKTRDLRALETPLELENKLSSFERGVGRFKEQMKGIGYGLAALASQGVQNVIGENPVTQGITDWGLEGYNETTAKSQPGAMYAPKVAKVEDIKTPSDALEWGAGLLGEQLPLVGSLLLTGGIGGAVARLGANAAVKDIAGAAVGSAVKKGVEQGALKAVEGQLVTDTMRKAASKALLDTTLKGAAVAGYAGTAGLEGGLSFGESVQSGAKPEDAVKSAIAVGGINGALELLTPFVIAKKMGLGEYAKKSIADIISNDADLSKKAIALATAKELGTRGIKGFAEGATVEGITEGLQELTSIAGERWAKNSQLFADLTDEDWSRIKNSVAGGTFIGGGLSGAGATVSGPQTEQTKVQTKITVPAQSKLDVLKANQAKLVEQINETIKAGDIKKAEELQAIKDIYDLAINKTQEVIPAQEKPALEGELVQEPAKKTPVSEVAPAAEAGTPTLETVKPTEEEQEALIQEAPVQEPLIQEPPVVPAPSEIVQPPTQEIPAQETPINTPSVNFDEQGIFEHTFTENETPTIVVSGRYDEDQKELYIKRIDKNPNLRERKGLGVEALQSLIADAELQGKPVDKVTAEASESFVKSLKRSPFADRLTVTDIPGIKEKDVVIDLKSPTLTQPTEDTANTQEVQAQTEAPLTEPPVQEPSNIIASSLASNKNPTTGPDILFSKPVQEPAPTFYSALERTVQEIKQEKAPAVQWESSLDNMVKKGLVKQEELDWSGTKEWLREQKEPVTKEALLQHVRDNTLEVKETLLGAGAPRVTHNPDNNQWEVYDLDGNLVGAVDGARDDSDTEVSRFGNELADLASPFYGNTNYEANTRNAKWTLPGGKNQRELVLTVPSIKPFNTDDTTHYGDVGGGRAVAWVRFNDRVDENGKKILFLEEVQSKRHQEGKASGYSGEWTAEKLLVDDTFKIEVQSFEGESEWSVREKENGNLIAAGDTKEEAVSKALDELNKKGIPNAPFKQTIAGSGQTLSGWAGLAFKRMLRYAVENGYDKVAWTTGEQQAKRYNLAQSVSKVAYTSDGYFQAYDRNGRVVMSSLMDENEVPNYIGKELTNELLAAPVKGGERTVEFAEDKVIGGEGMKGFYDRLLPNEINKYVKKWGAKVDKTQMKFGDESASVHSIEVTPAMRDSVMQGQPFYSKPQEDTNAFKVWSKGYPVIEDAKPNSKEKNNFETGKPFVAKVYHGSESNLIEEFDPNKLGDNTKAASARKGFFFSGNPATASAEYYIGTPKEGIDPNITDDDFNWDFYYISGSALNFYKSTKLTLSGLQKLDGQGNVPTKTILVVYPSKQLKSILEDNDITSMVFVEKDKEGWRISIDNTHQIGDYYDDLQEAVYNAWLLIEKYIKNLFKNNPKLNENTTPTIYPAYIRISNPMVYDQKGKEYREITYNDLLKKAKKNNHDGLVILNTYDGGPLDNIFVVFDNKNIKGYYNKGTFDETGKLLESQNTQGTQQTNIPLQDFHSNIDSIMGEGWLQKAIDLGLVEVIEGVGPNGESGSWVGDKIRLYTDTMPEGGSPAGVLLHEGKHHTFDEVLGDSLPEYVKDLHTLAANGNKIARDAIAHAAIVTADLLGIKHNLRKNSNKADLNAVRELIEQRQPGLLAEEELAYFVQYGVDAQTGIGFWKRLVNQIKAWFAQTRLGQRMKELGLGFELTDGMAVEWAKMGLNMSLQEAKQAAKAKVRIEKQAANMPASARLGKALEALENVNPLYSMGIKEMREQLWNDPTDPRLEIVNKPGLLQKFRADFVDFFGEMEKKSKNVYDTYILQRAKKGARIEKSRQTYLLPLRELIANSPWDAKEVGDMLAARHIKVDNVNTDLAERASQGYTKKLLKALPGAKQKELKQARVNIKAGKMPDGSVYKDANGNVVAMSARTKRKLMFDLMNQYAPFEIANTAGVQELNQEWEIFKDAAGGFSNGGIARGIVRTVDNVLAPASKAPAKFDEIANLFDAMNRHTLDILEEGGLITAREHARLLTSKSAYAPLRRKSYNINRETELLFQKASAGGSKQIGTRAGTANLSEPTLVLQNALAKLEATAAAVERNLANQELYNTIMTDREGWKPWFTIADKDQYVTHDEDGFLQEKHATASNRGDIVLIKDGKKIVIQPNMHNERATGFVRAVNNMDAQTLNGPMKIMSWVNSLIRWTNISASPIFLMTNLIRDPLTAAYNLQATEAAEYSKDIFLNWKRAFKALKKVYIDNNRDLTDADVKMLEKFEKAGGRTSFVLSLKEMDNNSFSNFEGQVARRQGSMKYLMKAKDTWLDGIENYNILFENIMRFSTFMTLQEKSQGKISEQRAARIAQDITTNFSRRGYKSQMLGVWWLFFNASVQGNYQVLRNLMSSKRVQVAVGGTIATAVMLDVLGRALTDDWDEIPEWDKERNIILPIKVGGDFVKIPAPWVYNVFWRMGGMIGETLAGKRKPQDTILDMTALTFTTLDPLGKPGSLAQAISPTAADPFVQILENKNFAGNPIGPEGYPGASTKANSELLWSTTPKGYQSFARFVNEATGGSAVESGKIDLRPGDYQLLADFLTGSFGKFLTDTTFGFANKFDKGIEGPKDIPIIKEFFSDPSNSMMVQKYHTNIATIYGAHRLEQMYVKGPERDLIKLQEVREKRGNELRMYAQAQDVEKQLKSLRVKLRAAQNREDTGREKELKERMNKVQEQFNKKFEQNVK